jgi:hypothetical protein
MSHTADRRARSGQVGHVLPALESSEQLRSSHDRALGTGGAEHCAKKLSQCRQVGAANINIYIYIYILLYAYFKLINNINTLI